MGRLPQSFLLILSILAGAVTARAGFDTPAWRPANATQASADLTTYQEWDVFTSPAGPNAPDIASINPNAGTPDAYDTSGGSFITSGSNIYSFAVPLEIEVTLPSYDMGVGYQTEFILQLRTQGTELDILSLTIDDAAASTYSGYSYEELDRVSLGGFGGALVDHKFTFTVPTSLSSYELAWDALGSSLSQDNIVIDTLTAAVPEPGSVALVLSGIATIALRRRRRSASN